jgi:hypothetical protein
MLAGRESDHGPVTEEQQQQSLTTINTASTINFQALSVTSHSKGTTHLSTGTSGSHTAGRAERKGSGRRSPEDEDSEEGEGEEESSDDGEDSSEEEEEERDQVMDLSQKKLPRPGGRGKGGRGEGGMNMLFQVGVRSAMTR